MALVNQKLTDLTEKLSVPDDALIHIVDPNDFSQSPQGSSYKAKKSTISGTVKAQKTVSGTVKTNSNSSDPIVYLKSEVDELIKIEIYDENFTYISGLQKFDLGVKVKIIGVQLNSSPFIKKTDYTLVNNILTYLPTLSENDELIIKGLK